jgi:hypothetical protein
MTRRAPVIDSGWHYSQDHPPKCTKIGLVHCRQSLDKLSVPSRDGRRVNSKVILLGQEQKIENTRMIC